MKNRLFFPVFLGYLIFSLATLRSEEEPKKGAPLADTDGLPSSLIDNCVSAITGNYIDSAIDLEVIGPEPLEFSRFYTSGYCTTSALHRGWMHNHESYANTFHDPAFLGTYGHLREPSGRYSVYYTEDFLSSHTSHYGLLLSKNRGLTNVGYGKISAQTNLKNTYLEENDKRRTLLATSGDNTQRFYKALKNSKGETAFPSIQWEKKPNGRQLIYEYDKNCALTKVRLTNSKGTKDFASINFSGLNKKLDKENPALKNWIKRIPHWK